MEFKRDKYLNELIDKMGNSLVKVITGSRRCGKSYLMNKIFYEYSISTGVDMKCYIQSCLNSHNQEVLVRVKKSLYYIDDSFKKTIITKDGLSIRKDDIGVTTMDIFDFLLDFDSLDKYNQTQT